ncbi:MAG: AAA family ATPase [Myxococcota bacterium]
MIERLQVRGYKSLVDVEVELGPLTVFVGANGSGKTSVLEAINLLQTLLLWSRFTELYQLDYPDWFDLPRVASRQSSKDSIEIGFSLPEVSSRGSLEGAFGLEQFLVRFDNATIVQIDDDPQSKGKCSVSDQLYGSLLGIRMFRLDTRAMAGAAYSHETDPTLGFDGKNLAAVLDALQGEARERFDEIERRLREFVPSLRHLRVKRARTRRSDDVEVVGHQVSFDFEHAANIRADDASEGTLLLLGLLTVIEANAPDQPMTIMLDDLDRALHPKAQRDLVGYLHELIRSRPGLQIIATTHSSYLVEHLEFEEVRAITQAPDGTSVIGSLIDHPEAERWRDEMSAGEFWSSVGESWVAAHAARSVFVATTSAASSGSSRT